MSGPSGDVHSSDAPLTQEQPLQTELVTALRDATLRFEKGLALRHARYVFLESVHPLLCRLHLRWALSRGPQTESAVKFLESGGASVTVTSREAAEEALTGRAGTMIVT